MENSQNFQNEGYLENQCGLLYKYGNEYQRFDHLKRVLCFENEETVLLQGYEGRI